MLRSMQEGRFQAAALGAMPAKTFFEAPHHPRRGGRLLCPPDRLERDRLGRPGQPARLCAAEARHARPVGAGRSRARPARSGPGGRTAVSAEPVDRTPRARRPRPGRVPPRRLDPDARVRRRRSRSISSWSAPAPAAARRSPASPSRDSPWSASTPARIGARSRTSPPTRPSRTSCTGPTTGSRKARTRSRWAATTAASRSAAAPSTLRWSRSASGRNGSAPAPPLGYGADWPVDWREMWDYYARAEQALAISGP